MKLETPVLAAEGIVAGYRELDILHGVTVEVRPREVVCVIGPNGAGKSTLLKAIFGLLRARAGRVLFEGRDVTGTAPDRMVAAGVAYVPQLANVFPRLTVDENLDMGAFTRADRVDEARETVHGIFPALQERARQKVGRMSGGERQMVAIGRALMAEPRVILLDEPTAALAPRLQDEVLAQVRRVAESGTPALVVEQNVKRGLGASDRAYVLDQGRNKYEGPARELLSDPRVGRLYVGGD